MIFSGCCRTFLHMFAVDASLYSRALVRFRGVGADISINMGIVIGYLVAFGVAATVEGTSECNTERFQSTQSRPMLLYCCATPLRKLSTGFPSI